VSIIRNWAKRVYYFGWKHACCFCGARLRCFGTIGWEAPVIKEKRIIGAGLRDCVCPHCGSYDRDRLIYLYLRDHTALFRQPATVLHIAPETQLAQEISAHPQIRYIAGDKFEDGYHYPAWCQCMDITRVDLADDEVDYILCSHVLEHVPDDHTAMSELFRVLKSGGLAILQVPISYVIPHTLENPLVTDELSRFRLYGQRDHVRLYGPDYFDRLRKVGFLVERIQPHHITPHINYYGLNSEEDLFLALKPFGK